MENIMKTMILEKAGSPLQLREADIPHPAPDQVLIRVGACGICRTDLHIYEGDLKEAKLPLVLGHEIVGTIVEVGVNVKTLSKGERIGVPWLGNSCEKCVHCRSGMENLCDHAVFTGYHIDGGYAEYALAHSRYCFSIPRLYSDEAAAPLSCAGLIGYRALRMAGEVEKVGLYGFGAAAHIITQVACYQKRTVYAFTRPGDDKGQAFAKEFGASWAGGADILPPELLDAAIIFAPVGALVPQALRAVRKGGIVVCAGIHMSDIPSFPYDLLWGERTICSVANLTRQDGIDFFQIAPKIPIRTEVETFTLEQATEALERLRNGQIQGAAVLVMDPHSM